MQQLIDNAKPKVCIVWLIWENEEIALVVYRVAMSIIDYCRLEVICYVFQHVLHEISQLPSKMILCKVHVELAMTIWKIRMICLRLGQDAKYKLGKFFNWKIFKTTLSPSKKLVLFNSMKVFKNDEKRFLFHFKNSFCLKVHHKATLLVRFFGYWKPFENYEKCFLFHLKIFFSFSKDLFLIFWSCRKTVWLEI